MGITLHNQLTGPAAMNTALLFQGQDTIPDRVGAPTGGGTQTYCFTASRPGTYLYEAGLVPNAEHQVAMGLYGALIIRPAGFPVRRPMPTLTPPSTTKGCSCSVRSTRL